jgi:tetratricopeptide (TPR) repeat protein
VVFGASRYVQRDLIVEGESMSHRLFLSLVIVSTSWAVTAAGCASSRQASWEAAEASAEAQTPEAQSRRQALVEEAEALWEERDDADKLRQAIEKWEQALEVDPSQDATWADLSRGYYFLADCHLLFDDEQKDQMMEVYEKSTQAAEQGLMQQSPEFRKRMQAGARMEEAVTVLKKEAVPALYWRSAALGKWAAAKGFATLLSYKDEVRAVMTHVLELDRTYYFGGPDRYFGAFFARAPSFAGGDLDRSKAHFEASLQQEPNYFATRVLYAEDYGVKAQDRAVFDQQLDYVLNTDPEVLPPVAPENRCEQRKAEKAKAKAGEVFE